MGTFRELSHVSQTQILSHKMAMTTSFLGAAVVAKVQPKVAARKAVVAKASLADDAKKAAVVAATSLLVASPAFAATIKLGGDNGELGFYPPSITVAKGEKIEFVNNKAFPHNVVFDADKISHEDYLNGPGETVSNTFDTPGTYGYYCE